MAAAIDQAIDLVMRGVRMFLVAESALRFTHVDYGREEYITELSEAALCWVAYALRNRLLDHRVRELDQEFIPDFHLHANMSPTQVAAEDAVLFTILDRVDRAADIIEAREGDSAYFVAVDIAKTGNLIEVAPRCPSLRPGAVHESPASETDVCPHSLSCTVSTRREPICLSLVLVSPAFGFR